MGIIDGFLKKLGETLPSFIDINHQEELPTEVMNALKKQFPELPPEKLEIVIHSFLKLLREETLGLVNSPELSQQKKIEAFIAKIIADKFKFSISTAQNIVFHLLTGDSEKQEKFVKCPVSFNELESVKKDLLGIDIVYQRLSSSKWQYATRVFVTLANKTIKYESKCELYSDELPTNIRNAFLNEKQDKQRLILYPPIQEKKNG